MKILLTGFEPWGKWKDNPSGQVAAELDGKHFDGAEVVGVVLPVSYGEDIQKILPVVAEHDPAAVVSLGLGGGATLKVERVAVNLKTDDAPILVDGPAAYLSTLPTRSIVDCLVSGGIPAQLSYHAGTFLCNHIMYQVLHHLSDTGRDIPSGFIHVPPTPDLAAAQGLSRPSMSIDNIRQGTVLAIENLVGFFER